MIQLFDIFTCKFQELTEQDSSVAQRLQSLYAGVCVSRFVVSLSKKPNWVLQSFLTSDSMNRTLKCDHSLKSCWCCLCFNLISSFLFWDFELPGVNKRVYVPSGFSQGFSRAFLEKEQIILSILAVICQKGCISFYGCKLIKTGKKLLLVPLKK